MQYENYKQRNIASYTSLAGGTTKQSSQKTQGNCRLLHSVRNDGVLNEAAYQTNISKKICKHRSENGWCSKTQRVCALLKNNLN